MGSSAGISSSDISWKRDRLICRDLFSRNKVIVIFFVCLFIEICVFYLFIVRFFSSDECRTAEAEKQDTEHHRETGKVGPAD